MGTLYLPANSTEQIRSALEPRLASSSISSKAYRTQAFGGRHDAGVGRIDTIDIGVNQALIGLDGGSDGQLRKVSEPPRPGVVILPPG